MGRKKRHPEMYLKERYILYNKRRFLNISQLKMSEMLGLFNAQAIGRYENGSVIPDKETRTKICEILYLNENKVWGTKS